MASDFFSMFIRQRALTLIADAIAKYLSKTDPAAIQNYATADSDLVTDLEANLLPLLTEDKMGEYRSVIAQHIHLFAESDLADLFRRVLVRLDPERRRILQENSRWCLGQLKRVWLQLCTMVGGGQSGALGL